MENKLFKLIFLVVLVLLGTSSFAKSGPSDGGGTNTKTSNQSVLTQMIQDGGLQNAMVNYVKTINIQKISNDEVNSIFKNLVTKELLIADIQTPHIYEIKPDCRDRYNNQVAASTQIGKPGTPICFNIEALAEDYKNLDEEEMMIRLAAVAFHEHIHHFQDPKNPIKQNENQGFYFESYVRLTAKILQVPLLKWSESAEECPDYSGYYEYYSNNNGSPDIFHYEIKKLSKYEVTIDIDGDPLLNPVKVIIFDGIKHTIADHNDSSYESYKGYCAKDKMVIQSFGTTYRVDSSQKPEKNGTQINTITIQRFENLLYVEEKNEIYDLQNKIKDIQIQNINLQKIR